MSESRLDLADHWNPVTHNYNVIWIEFAASNLDRKEQLFLSVSHRMNMKKDIDILYATWLYVQIKHNKSLFSVLLNYLQERLIIPGFGDVHFITAFWLHPFWSSPAALFDLMDMYKK